MRAVTLLALLFTVYGNINKTWKKCHDKAKDRIAQKLLCFTHDLDTEHQR